MLSFAADKSILFPDNFSKNSNLDESGVFLPAFSSRTIPQMRNIPQTPTLVKKV